MWNFFVGGKSSIFYQSTKDWEGEDQMESRGEMVVNKRMQGRHLELRGIRNGMEI